MGEAKKRGTFAKRVELAIERRQIRSLSCNDCSSEITDLQYMETKEIPGLHIACVGQCPKCKATTWGFSGTPEAQAIAQEFLSDLNDAPSNASFQRAFRKGA